MTLLYGEIFSRAWQLTWKHKILWLFGFFAMLGGGSGGGNGGGGSNFNNGGSRGFPQGNSFGGGNGLPPQVNAFFDQFNRLDITSIVLIIVGVCLCLFLLWLAFQALSVLGQGGLIGGIHLAEINNKVTFGEAWAIGRKYFWKLVLLRLLRVAVEIAVGLLMILPGLILALCTCCIGNIIVSIALGFLISYAFLFMDMAVVLEGKTVGESINRAYALLQENLGPVVVTALVLFAISLGVGLISLVAMLPFVGLIVASLWPIITSTGGAINMTLLISALVMFVIGILACMFVESVWTTYRTAVIVLVYKKLMQKPGEPILVENSPVASAGILTT
jgi:hypothetical protein